MKKLLAFVMVLGLCLVAWAEDVKPTLFNGNEIGPVVYGAYNLDTEEWGVAAGGQVFPLQKYLGLEASSTFYDTTGRFVDTLSGDLILRLPLEELHLAPFGTFGVRYDFETDEAEPTAGAGVEFRVNSKWGVIGRYERLLERNDGVAKIGLALKF